MSNYPHSVEAEQAVLGALLVNNELLDKVPDLAEKHFFDPLHADIFSTIRNKIGDGRLASPITLKLVFENDDRFKDVGGVGYLARLAGSAQEYAVSDHGKHVMETWSMRTAQKALEGGLERVNARKPEDSPEKILNGVEADLSEAVALSASKPLTKNFAQAMVEAIKNMSTAYQDDGVVGVSTGLKALDKKIGGLGKGELVILAGRPSMGKAQPLDSPILMRDGSWRPMADIRLGDEVASENGRQSRIVGIYPRGVKQVYRVTFSDGRSVRCCGEHLWSVESSRFRDQRTITTDALRDMLSRTRYRRRIRVPLVSGHFGHRRELPVDPWLLGAIIGNGCLTRETPSFSTGDAQTLWQVQCSLGANQRVSSSGSYDFRLCGVAHGQNDLTDSLSRLGLMGKRAEEKSVPKEYLSASREVRLALLQGMMDTDGWVETFGAVRYSTSSVDLANDVQALVRSLGGLCTISVKKPKYTSHGEIKVGLDHYVCNIRHEDAGQFFTLIRKKRRCVRSKPVSLTIVSIEPDGREPVQCISVSNPSHLYVTEEYTLTHNSAVAFNVATKAASRGEGAFFGSMEMGADQLAMRYFSQNMAERGQEIPYFAMRNGRIDENQFRDVVTSAKDFENLPLIFAERECRQLSRLRSAIRRAQKQFQANGTPLGLIVVDYLQLLDPDGLYRRDSTVDRVSAASNALKVLAGDFDVPVLALSQLSREVERRDPAVPILSDLRDSGAIEQDADVVMFCYRGEYYTEKKLQSAQNEKTKVSDQADLESLLAAQRNKLDLIIAKQRQGPTSTVSAHFNVKLNLLCDWGDEPVFKREMEGEMF